MSLAQISTGRILLLTKNKAIQSPILQGEIYLKAKGEELISYLSQVYCEKHFRKYIETFISRYYRFRKSDEPIEEIPAENIMQKEILDFNKLKYEAMFQCNSLYLKSLSPTAINIRFRDGTEVVLKEGETIASCNGKATPYPIIRVVKTKDTIQPIVLIEKIN